ncbi:unnamed protein product [Amoebophrya sp. A120]|nr:unnamed protein product [Amoebophrya sp. A120]|eukprot:GSA120T00020387001.1
MSACSCSPNPTSSHVGRDVRRPSAYSEAGRLFSTSTSLPRGMTTTFLPRWEEAETNNSCDTFSLQKNNRSLVDTKNNQENSSVAAPATGTKLSLSLTSSSRIKRHEGRAAREQEELGDGVQLLHELASRRGSCTTTSVTTTTSSTRLHEQRGELCTTYLRTQCGKSSCGATTAPGATTAFRSTSSRCSCSIATAAAKMTTTVSSDREEGSSGPASASFSAPVAGPPSAACSTTSRLTSSQLELPRKTTARMAEPRPTSAPSSLAGTSSYNCAVVNKVGQQRAGRSMAEPQLADTTQSSTEKRKAKGKALFGTTTRSAAGTASSCRTSGSQTSFLNLNKAAGQHHAGRKRHGDGRAASVKNMASPSSGAEEKMSFCRPCACACSTPATAGSTCSASTSSSSSRNSFFLSASLRTIFATSVGMLLFLPTQVRFAAANFVPDFEVFGENDDHARLAPELRPTALLEQTAPGPGPAPSPGNAKAPAQQQATVTDDDVFSNVTNVVKGQKHYDGDAETALDNGMPDLVKQEQKDLSLSGQIRSLVEQEKNAKTCHKHPCTLVGLKINEKGIVDKGGSHDLKYTLDADKKCGTDTEAGTSCDDLCCSYVYCITQLDDVIADFMYQGMSPDSDSDTSKSLSPKRKHVMFPACKPDKTVKDGDIQVGGTVDSDQREQSFKKMPVNKVRASECKDRVGFFHWPSLDHLNGLPLRRDVLHGVADKNSKDVGYFFPTARPLHFKDLKTPKQIGQSKKENPDTLSNKEERGLTDFEDDDEIVLRGAFEFTATPIVWENPFIGAAAGTLYTNPDDDNSQPGSGGGGGSGGTVGGGGAFMQLSAGQETRRQTLRLIVADSRGQNHPLFNKAYSDEPKDWHIPKSREAYMVGGTMDDYIDLAECCSVVVQAMTDDHYYNLEGQKQPERFVVQNCVVFTENMHEHLYGTTSTTTTSQASFLQLGETEIELQVTV